MISNSMVLLIAAGFWGFIGLAGIMVWVCFEIVDKYILNQNTKNEVKV